MNIIEQNTSTLSTIDNVKPSSLYSVHQVSDMLGVTSKTIRSWVKKGRVTAIRLGPCSTRIPGHAITDLISGTDSPNV